MKTSERSDLGVTPRHAEPSPESERARDGRRWRRFDLFVGVFALLSVLVSGCANQPGTAETAAGQPAGSVPKGMAELYLFNDGGSALASGNQEVTDNGKAIASLPRQAYTRLVIVPGTHVLRLAPLLWQQAVTLNAEAGARYYVVIGSKPGRSWASPMGGSPPLRQLTEEQARPLMTEMKLH